MDTRKLKKISIYTKINNEQGEEFLSSEQEFNEDEQLISNKEYDNENNLTFLLEMSYNENKQPVKEVSDHISDGFKEIKTMEYDEKGKLVKEKTEYFGGAYSVKKYIRNANEKSVEIITYDEDDEIEESQKLNYDDKNRIISKSEFDDKGKLVEKTVIVYDEDTDELIQREEYNRKNKLEKIHFYNYDESGRLTSVITENSKGKMLDWVKFAYDSDNKLVLQKTMSGTMIKIDYKNNNKLKKEEHYNQAGAKINEITTQLDEKGRVISETSLGKELVYRYDWH